MTSALKFLHGHPGTLHVARARAELRAGRPVRVCGPDQTRIAIAVDTLRPAVLGALAGLPHADLRLAVTRERAAALGTLPGAAPREAHGGATADVPGTALDDALSVPVEPDVSLAELRALAGASDEREVRVGGGIDTASAAAARTGGTSAALPAGTVAATSVERAALALAKHSLLLPTVLSVRDDDGAREQLLSVETRAIATYADAESIDLERTAEATVPLADAPLCRFVVFRDRRDGSEHVAVLVGGVDPAQVTDVRVHSACLTGDLLASLRCDCGDQLRGAVRRFAGLGAGVLLYVGQEGRGIGLANKVRAYRLQEAGLDTIDADRHLGFAGDERRYEVAAALLHELGIARVRLHTNNPRKAGALAALGVTVVDFRTLAGAVNPHNESYIRVRRERAGHLVPDGQ